MASSLGTTIYAGELASIPVRLHGESLATRVVVKPACTVSAEGTRLVASDVLLSSQQGCIGSLRNLKASAAGAAQES